MNFYKLLIISFLCIAFNEIAAQKNYFQQQADYKIAVTLDDEKHFLRGQWTMKYQNNSPDTLKFIYLHLYPNAYKNRNTALGRQLTADGNLGWYFEKEEARGYIDSLEFKADNQKLNWQFKDGFIDIAKVELATPLAPNQSVEISSPMRLKIPKSVSRLGHVEQSYQITQWYPKPAVYDREGWHEMPYLNQGEFYSEYGSFEVSLTLPENYVVGASGDLQNQSEKEFLQKRADFTKAYDFKSINPKNLQDTFPVSSKTFKTITYKIENAHDFAFFADKRYFVLIDSVQLKNGKMVTTYAMFSKEEADLWQDASLYLKRSVDFYSNVVGFYPYNQVTAVQSALGAGGGMEYPTVTVIGLSGDARALEVVIMHEVGHNWFYGILGSNERLNAWQDEGFNSYVESRYEDAYLSKEMLDQKQLAFLYQARRGEEQPVCTHSQDATPINYYLTAYAKPTMLLRHLERYLGTEKMDYILHQYFDKWKYRHPSPADLQAVFEQETGENLDWFFKDWLQTTKTIDYAITRQRFEKDSFYITVKNKGELTIPISLNHKYDTNSTEQAIWVKNLRPNQDTNIVIAASTQTVVQLDAYNNVPDIQPSNNKKEKFTVGLIPNFRKLTAKRLNLLPILGYNRYDGFMLGLAAYNSPLPLRKWQYIISPMFGFGGKNLVGMADIQYNHLPSQHLPYQRLTIGFSARSYHYFKNEQYDYQTRYVRLQNFVELELPRKRRNSKLRQEISFQNLVFGEERPVFTSVVSPDTVYFAVNDKTYKWRSTHRLQYSISNGRKLNPYSALAVLEYANYQSFNQTQHYLKLSTESNHRFMYNAFSAADIRLFAGGFIAHTDRIFGAFPLQLASRNVTDYQYDNLFLGRSQQTGFFSQQISLQEGGFKTPIARAVNDGHTNKFLIAANFKTAIPIRLHIGMKWLRIKPYFDVAYFVNSEPSLQIQSISQTLFYNGGFMLDIVNGMAGVYFPVVSNTDLSRQLQSQGNYWTRISFSVNTRALNPIRLARKVEII